MFRSDQCGIYHHEWDYSVASDFKGTGIEADQRRNSDNKLSEFQ